MTLRLLNRSKGNSIEVDTRVVARESKSNTKLVILRQVLFSKPAACVYQVPIQTSVCTNPSRPQHTLEVFRRPRDTAGTYIGASVDIVIVDILVDVHIAFERVGACFEELLVDLLVEHVFIRITRSSSKHFSSRCGALVTLATETESIRIGRHYPWRSCSVVKAGVDEVSRLSFGGCGGRGGSLRDDC